MIANAAAFGFTDTTSPCIVTTGCNPDQFIFWDSVHPMARAQELLGAAMAESIPAPEPATLAHVALGLMRFAFTRRRIR